MFESLGFRFQWSYAHMSITADCNQLQLTAIKLNTKKLQ